MTVTWKKIHADGPDHAFAEGREDALCGAPPDGELLDPDEDRCLTCMVTHGTALADAQGDASWRM